MRTILTVVFLFTLPVINGCTAIGNALGNAIDSRNATYESTTVVLTDLKIDETIQIWMRDSSMESGLYKGMGQSDAETKIPELYVGSKSGLRSIPIDDIDRIEKLVRHKRKGGRIVGTSLGFLIDAFIITAILTFPSDGY
jgi:hypothetical protein